VSGNLRDRLRRIKEHTKDAITPATVAAFGQSAAASQEQLGSIGWIQAGFQCVKREFTAALSPALPAEIPAILPALIPDLGKGGGLPKPECLLFFDLETTGLSGGAGTVAFLAAFGRLLLPGSAAKRLVSGSAELHITQYLLLDYPGEADFLEALLPEFKKEPLLIVSYNGKTFDSQILKTRYLMHGIQPPEYRHADLLYPARRLWKRILSDCSQGTIETSILGIDRHDDIPGALAPEIWFSFLKNGDTGPLMGICKHNCRDITGLASIFSVMCHISLNPSGALKTFNFDIEQLALRWRDYLKDGGCFSGGLYTGSKALLRLAWEKGCPRASLVYALDTLHSGDYDKGRACLFHIADGVFPAEIQAAALRALAIDSEWRQRSLLEAIRLAERGMELPDIGAARRIEFRRRVERLMKKRNRIQRNSLTN
jgi:uncharacterized protein YprB with RNaseH-like and TPR domain